MDRDFVLRNLTRVDRYEWFFFSHEHFNSNLDRNDPDGSGIDVETYEDYQRRPVFQLVFDSGTVEVYRPG